MIAGSPIPKRQRRGHGRPTLHDVAIAAEVTRITVSRFIREPGKVADDTAARIRLAIEQTGYVPNHQAGHLASGASRLIAALIPNVGHSIFAETIQGMTESLRDSGHELLLLSTGYSLEREEAQLRALLGWAPGALIVTGRRRTAGSLRMLHKAHASGTPVIEIWDQSSSSERSEGFAQIGFNHQAVGRVMARHLLDLGHTALAYVDSGVAEDFRAHERGEGFAAEARAAGVSVRTLTASTGDPLDVGRKTVAQLVSGQSPTTTAVAFANDHLACGALLEAQARGVDVPGTLAMLGFGDFPIGSHLHPGLSTVHPRRNEIGRAAASAALSAMVEGTEPASVNMPCRLIGRGTTRPDPCNGPL